MGSQGLPWGSLRDWNEIITDDKEPKRWFTASVLYYNIRRCYSQSPDLRHVIETGDRNPGDVVVVEGTVRREKKEGIRDWSITCISSPTHYLQKQPVKILGKQQDPLPGSCDNVWHTMKDIAQGKQPTAASGWLEVTVCHIWVTRGTEDEFFINFWNKSRPGSSAATLLKNPEQAEWRDIRPTAFEGNLKHFEVLWPKESCWLSQAR